MGKFGLTIDLGNDAMQSPADVGRALDKVAATLVTAGWDGIEGGRIRDENGNTVGSWTANPPMTAADREALTWDDVDGSECQVCGGQIPPEREFCPDCDARSALV